MKITPTIFFNDIKPVFPRFKLAFGVFLRKLCISRCFLGGNTASEGKTEFYFSYERLKTFLCGVNFTKNFYLRASGWGFSKVISSPVKPCGGNTIILFTSFVSSLFSRIKKQAGLVITSVFPLPRNFLSVFWKSEDCSISLKLDCIAWLKNFLPPKLKCGSCRCF